MSLKNLLAFAIANISLGLSRPLIDTMHRTNPYTRQLEETTETSAEVKDEEILICSCEEGDIDCKIDPDCPNKE